MIFFSTINSEISPLKLRGHHLLCVFGWKGDGYNAEFNEKMDKVSALLTRANCQISIVNGPDDLCRSCPNLLSTGCQKKQQLKEKEVLAHDKRVLDFLDLKANYKINAQDLRSVIAGKAVHRSLSSICAGCQWLDKPYCYDGLGKISSG